jgi:hypothetical protein
VGKTPEQVSRQYKVTRTLNVLWVETPREWDM